MWPVGLKFGGGEDDGPLQAEEPLADYPDVRGVVVESRYRDGDGDGVGDGVVWTTLRRGCRKLAPRVRKLCLLFYTGGV